jgi:hypothetical protein
MAGELDRLANCERMRARQVFDRDEFIPVPEFEAIPDSLHGEEHDMQLVQGRHSVWRRGEVSRSA